MEGPRPSVPFEWSIPFHERKPENQAKNDQLKIGLSADTFGIQSAEFNSPN